MYRAAFAVQLTSVAFGADGHPPISLEKSGRFATMNGLDQIRFAYAEVGMTTLSTIPVQISEEAAQHIEQLGLQEPFQRMLDEIPKRIQATQWIKVGLEH